MKHVYNNTLLTEIKLQYIGDGPCYTIARMFGKITSFVSTNDERTILVLSFWE